MSTMVKKMQKIWNQRMHRRYRYDGREIQFEHRFGKSVEIEIWCENQQVLRLLTQMPYRDLVEMIFIALRTDRKMKFDRVCVVDDRKFGNAYSRRERVWLFTMGGIIQMVMGVAQQKGLSTTALTAFFQCNGYEFKEGTECDLSSLVTSMNE